MELLLDVIRVVPQKDRTLLLTFENNEQRIFDMIPYLGKKPFLQLKKLPLFMKAKAENGTVVWPGNIDIAPETLWDYSRAVWELKNGSVQERIDR
ncbi:MAG: DUF2442 domain-containing protein [Candidatus Electrothrix sp. Rat3]|nr:DUF2442 domain-containing protein [Candidatus Electrothrix rattekaaiensis]